jgi:hypothetical protein
MSGDARRSRRRRGHSTSTTRSRADDVRQTARHRSTFSTCSRIRQASQPLASSGLRRCRYREPRTPPTSSPWMHREHLQLTLPAVVQSTPASPTGRAQCVDGRAGRLSLRPHEGAAPPGCVRSYSQPLWMPFVVCRALVALPLPLQTALMSSRESPAWLPFASGKPSAESGAPGGLKPQIGAAHQRVRFLNREIHRSAPPRAT